MLDLPLELYADICVVQKAPPKPKSSINYHLSRLYPKISGPKKRKGSLG